MCHEEHVHPLVQAFQAEGLVIQLVPNFKDKIEVSLVSYRGLLLTGVLDVFCVRCHCPRPVSFFMLVGSMVLLLKNMRVNGEGNASR
jgi:hypothetical protein